MDNGMTNTDGDIWTESRASRTILSIFYFMLYIPGSHILVKIVLEYASLLNNAVDDVRVNGRIIVSN